MNNKKPLIVVLSVLLLTGGVVAGATPAAETAPLSETRPCPTCGYILPAESVLCPICGHRFTDATIPGIDQPIKKPEPTPQPELPRPNRGAFYLSGRGYWGVSKSQVTGFEVAAGIHASPATVFAAGIGSRKYPNANAIPIFVMLRHYFFSSPSCSPFLFGRGGYNRSTLIECFHWDGKDYDNASGAEALLGGGLALGKIRKITFDIDVSLGLSVNNGYVAWVSGDGRLLTPPEVRQYTDFIFLVSAGLTH